MKVSDSLPPLGAQRGLVHDDFRRFSVSFTEIVQAHIPTAQSVTFVQKEQPGADDFIKNNLTASDRIVLDTLFRGEDRVAVVGPYVLLAFPTEAEESWHVGVAGPTEAVFYSKVRKDWLVEVREKIEREFLLLQQARTDLSTELLNLANLQQLLDDGGRERQPGLSLLLVELVPPRGGFENLIRFVHHCNLELRHFFAGASLQLHYLGHTTFAYVARPERSRRGGSLAGLAGQLVSFMKRRGFSKIHVGTADSHDDSSDELLQRAWQALRFGTRRGPYSHCDYETLAHPERHPLAAAPVSVLRRLQRLYKGVDRFSLVLFRCDDSKFDTSFVLSEPLLHERCPDLASVTTVTTVTLGNDLLVFLPDLEGTDALNWVQKIVDKLGRTGDDGAGVSLSAGIASYPFVDFSKSSCVACARKALIHAGFFGPGSCVLFDAVSLNISGDIYFGDGDFRRAVQEYRAGLRCNPAEVNLYNSLGVALAMMNQANGAIRAFEQSLELQTDDFFSLYNLGLAELNRGCKQKGYEYLTRAMDHISSYEQRDAIEADLCFELGCLANDLGDYKVSIALLEKWRAGVGDSAKQGRVCYPLGHAYYKEGQMVQAMTELQRALRKNEFDERAMYLLARIYLEEGQGVEIALSLSRKSVELEPKNLDYRLLLGELELLCGQEDGEEKLRSCLRYRQTRIAAQLLLSRHYLQTGRRKRALSWLKNVVSATESGSTERLQAEKMLKSSEMTDK